MQVSYPVFAMDNERNTDLPPSNNLQVTTRISKDQVWLHRTVASLPKIGFSVKKSSSEGGSAVLV